MFGKDKKEEYNEKVLYEAQPNIFVYSKGILISMFVLGFLFFLYSAGIRYIGNMNVYLIETTKAPLTSYFALVVFVLIMIVFAYIIIKLIIWSSIKYTITESRVIVEKGILLQKKNYMPFNTIQDVSRSQSFLGKIFSVGTVTLYSAYDGKELELKDVSSPKKIEDLIFENIRGTHLRYRNVYDDGSNFNPIRPNFDEPTHYRRMEDLDDLELVDAKERKRQLRDIRRKARDSRNNPNYNSNYNSSYGPENAYGDYPGDYYDDGAYDYNPSYGNNRDYGYDSDYRPNRAYDGRYYGVNSRDGRVGGADYRNNQNSRVRKPDSHHHQYSGAIKESYSRNPDKYFANNYEEFHQNNLDAQKDYDDYIQGRFTYQEPVKEEPQPENKSKGLSRFNPFSSSNDGNDAYEDISDEEFDTTINQAMHDMGDNIKFRPSNDNRYGDKGRSRQYDGYDDRYYDDYSDSYYDSTPARDNYQDSRYGRDNYQDSRYERDNHRDSRYERDNYHYSRPVRDNYSNTRPTNNNYSNSRPVRDDYNSNNYPNQNFRQNENYRKENRRNSYGNSQASRDVKSSRSYSNNRDGHRSRPYQDDGGEIDYKYRSPRESRKRSKRNSNSRYDGHNQYGQEPNAENNQKDAGNKASDDIFEKHSRKFRR